MITITQSELWELKAYQFKMLMFFQFVDSNINVEDDKVIQSVCSYIRVPPSIFRDGLEALYLMGYISFDDYGFIKIEVKVTGE